MNHSTNNIYANTHKQLLSEHSFAVGYIAKKLLEKHTDISKHSKLSETAFIAGCLHDWGKTDILFQDWVKKGKNKNEDDDGQHIDSPKKFSFENHPRHNEISLFIFNVFENYLIEKRLNGFQKNNLKHTLYWHHSKPFRKEDKFEEGVYAVYNYLLNNINTEGVKTVLTNSLDILKEIKELTNSYESSEEINHINKLNWSIVDFDEAIEDFEYNCKNDRYPEFKEYVNDSDFESLRKNIKENSKQNLLRACVISADRIVSSLKANELSNLIKERRLEEVLEKYQTEETNIKSLIEKSLKTFPDSERTRKQAEIAKQLTETNGITILAGSAGCGKTKIALEWASNKKAKKILWICPRVQVCQGIFEELTTSYLQEAKVEIYTGEFKFMNKWDNETKEDEYFTGDIIVTTIDQIVNTITTHTKVDSLLTYMESYVVFDEYHELINTENFNLLFSELIECKKTKKDDDTRVLLVSATPHYTYLNNVLDVEAEDVIEMPSFNESKYKINFETFDEDNLIDSPFYRSYKNKTFIIHNTAVGAQKSFLYKLRDENSILFHSMFKRSDKKHIFNEVFNCFKKGGNKKHDVLRSGQIVQASLNISSDYMVSEMSSPENILQRMGRLDRFGENKTTNELTIAITQNTIDGKVKGASAMFLNSLHMLKSASKWYKYLNEKLSNKEFTLPEIYELYKDFHIEHTDSIEEDLLKAFIVSIHKLKYKVTEPLKIITPKIKDNKQRMKKISLRGDSRFVQMAKVNVDNHKDPIFMDEYAYTPPTNNTETYDSLSFSLQRINEGAMIDFVAPFHGTIYPEHPSSKVSSIKLKKLLIEKHAREVGYPIYLSYTKSDLEKVNTIKPHEKFSTYYAVCSKQPVGMMSLENINKIIS